MMEGIITDLEIGERVRIWVRRGANKHMLEIPFYPKIYVLEKEFYKFERLFPDIILDVNFVSKKLGLSNKKRFSEIKISYRSFLKLKKIHEKLSFDIFHLDVYDELLIVRAPSLNPISIKVNNLIHGEYLWSENPGFPEELRVFILKKIADGTVAISLDGEKEIYSSPIEFIKRENPDIIFTNLKIRGKGFVVASIEDLKDIGVEGLMEKAYFSFSSPRRVVGLTIGNSVSSRQDYFALNEGLVLPVKENENVVIARLRDYIDVDATPLVITPNPGIYSDVMAIDFSSMFPHLILQYNISYENTTIKEIRKLPNKGFLPKIVEEPLKRRMMFKAIKHESARKRASILKLLLVACYGYAGKYDNRFGNTYVNHWINKLGREILANVIGQAEKFDLKVIYADTDSLFIQYKERNSAYDFVNWIKTKFNIPLKIEHDFTRIAFVKGLTKDRSVIKRYFGLTRNGEIIVKGLMTVRRNVPKIIREAQFELIKALLHGRKQAQITKIIDNYKKRILNNATVDDLAFEITLNKNWNNYKTNNYMTNIAKDLKLQKGAKLKLFYKGKKPALTSEYQGAYNAKKYLEVLKKAIKEILTIKLIKQI